MNNKNKVYQLKVRGAIHLFIEVAYFKYRLFGFSAGFGDINADGHNLALTPCL